MEETNTTPNLRPTFITVLCILTFIGSGWGIIDGFTSYMGADAVGDTMELVDEQMDEAMEDIEESGEMTDSQKGFMEKIMGGLSESLTADNVRKSSMVSILSCLLTLAGAFLMWNLNKKGYFLYIAGIVVTIIGMIVIFGGLIGAIAAGSAGFIGVVMIVLYGVNLKHMD